MTEEVTLAGDKMLMVEHDDGSVSISFDDKGTGRSCGKCSLCCKLLPIPVPLNKPAGSRCQFQKASKGCSIYPRRPMACKTWSCRWLSDPLAQGLKRPDRTHYVVDFSYGTATSTNEQTGVSTPVSMLQVWVDPAFRDAHRDPDLRTYLAMMAEKWQVGAIIRYGTQEAFLLLAPALTDGTWVERRDEFYPWSDQMPAQLNRVQPA